MSTSRPVSGDPFQSHLLAQKDRLGLRLRFMERKLEDASAREAIWGWVTYTRVVRNLTVESAATYVGAGVDWCLWTSAQGKAWQTATREDVEAWLRHLMLDREVGPARRKQFVACLRSFYRWADESGLVQGNPVAKVVAPKVEIRTPRKFTTEQLRRLLAACDRESLTGTRDYAMWLMLYATGARRGELLGMNLNDIEVKPRVVHVRLRGKARSERVLSIEGPVVEALVAWLAAREEVPPADPEPVWLSVGVKNLGERLQVSGLGQALRICARRAGVRPLPHPHMFRATFATEMYDQGVDLERLRLLMGHSSIETTRRYIAVSDKQLGLRMPTSRQREIAGLGDKAPLWVQEKLRESSAP